MNRIGFGFRSAACAALLSALSALAQQAGSVPPAILAAKKIFVSNAGADTGLFPHPFSGDPSRAYAQFYTDLKAAGQFEIVADPADADLVLALQLTAPSCPVTERGMIGVNCAPESVLHLVIYDRKTHFVLWTMTQSIGVADTQKAHDHNFDAAIFVLMEKFQQLSGKPVTPFK
ncbi:MAG: hypothetical protein ABSD44_05500 [Terracidiphilus sp.]